MKSEIYDLTNLKRLTSYPYPVNEVGIMVKHFVPQQEVCLERLFICFSFNKETYDNPQGGNLYPTFSVLPPGTILHHGQKVIHDELFFSYSPEVSKLLMQVLCSSGKSFRHMLFLPDTAFGNDLQRLRELLQTRMTLGVADRIDTLAMQMIFTGVTTALPPCSDETRQTDTGMKIQEIARELKQGKPLAPLLKQYGYSRRNFYYDWNRHFSVSPKQLLISARLDQARKLLLASRYSAAQIAEECGFSSLRYFHECFLKHCNCTPGEYRKRFRSNNLNPRKG